MLRVLVTLSPLMYRQAVAFSVQGARRGLVDVRTGPPEAMEAQIISFRPHLLVCNDTHGQAHSIPEDVLRTVPCCMEIVYTDGMDARLNADGRVTEMRNATTEDLQKAVDEAARFAQGEAFPG